MKDSKGSSSIQSGVLTVYYGSIAGAAGFKNNLEFCVISDE